ncbi:MAG: hypothetical protein KGJ64_03595 [Betaproteobacteria bacterium]|nr:hypothetical protein [Betaproteobacteria bacterium]
MPLRTPERVLGWDVGGAHLKVSCFTADGALLDVCQRPCALWRGVDQLHGAIHEVLRAQGPRPPLAHAVTMTGEMADLFPSRAQGVRSLVDALARELGARRIGFYAADGGWLRAAGVRASPQLAASNNWHASARALAARMDHALLVDMGSTTVDIVPVAAGRVLAEGACDSDRLALGELVYTGAVRTPVMALGEAAPVNGRDTPLMAELFATTADVYRVLGWLPEDADQHETADGAPKTPQASRQRLARMVGCDACDHPAETWEALAGWFADVQLGRIEAAAKRVLQRSDLPAQAPLVAAGVGAFVVERLAHRLGRQLWPYCTALGLRSQPALAWADRCAPAVAVGLLYLGHRA